MPDFKSNQSQQVELQKAALAPKWQQWLRTLDPVQLEVLEKNTLIKAGEPTIVQYKTPMPSRSQFRFIGSTSEARYVDSKISLSAAQRLMALDPTSNHVWTDWIFTQAGGGESSRGDVDAIVATLKRGLEVKHGEKMRARGKSLTPAELKADFERRWAEQGPGIVALVQNGNEDALEKISGSGGVKTATYGFSYDFPGYQSRYKNVEEATKAYFSVYKKAAEMNALLADPENRQEAGVEPDAKPVPMTPDKIEDVDKMNAATKVVRQFFQVRTARSDVRVANWKEKSVVYDDDIVTVIVPLTYSAAVKYGNDNWAWANRQKFQTDVKNATSPAWSNMVRNDSFVAYMMVHVPLRTYMTGTHASKKRTRWNHVALLVRDDDVTVYREDGTECSVENFMEEIAQSAQPYGPLPAPEPQAQYGPLVGQTRYPLQHDAAPRVEASVQAALDELHAFAKTFDRKSLVRDVAQIDINQPQDTAPGD